MNADSAFSRGKLNYGSVGLKYKHVKAVGKSIGNDENEDEDKDDVLNATIEKSKKVLALQKELIQQVLWNFDFAIGWWILYLGLYYKV